MKLTTELKKRILDTHSNNKLYRIIDEPKRDGYFLFSQEGVFTFIWMGGNIWQFRVLNINCMEEEALIDPVKILEQTFKEK
jgi:hypothetical protein